MTDLEFIEERGDTLSFIRGELLVVLDFGGIGEDKWFSVIVYRFDGDDYRNASGCRYSQTTEDRFGKFEDAWACVRRLFEREE